MSKGGAPHPVPQGQWRPGLQVGPAAGPPGTLGAFVKIGRSTLDDLKLPANHPLPGFVTASHVLAPPYLNRQAALGDPVLSPCPPPPRAGRLICALLGNFTIISPPNYVNTLDIALAVMTKAAPCRNIVPDPQQPANPATLRPVLACHTEEEIEALAEESAAVYISGNSTPFAAGRIAGTSSPQVSLQLSPQGHFYLYQGCLIVDSMDPRLPFSLPGDSGALVYSDALKAVGFVIGAIGPKTYLCSAEACLSFLQATFL